MIALKFTLLLVSLLLVRVILPASLLLSLGEWLKNLRSA